MVADVFAMRLRQARKGKKWAQVDVSNALHLRGYQPVHKWESGKSVPEIETIERIAGIFGIPAWWFMLDDQQISEIIETGGKFPGRLALPCAAVYHCDIVAFSSEVQPTFASF